MERRNFLRGLVGIAGAGLLIPELAKSAITQDPQIPEEGKVSVVDEVTVTKEIPTPTQQFAEPDFTKEFFNYLENNPVNFEWERVYETIFHDDNGVPRTCKLRKLRVKWTPEISVDLHAFHGVNLEKELMEMLMQEVVRELEMEFKKGVITDQSNVAMPLKFYFKELMTTPTMYDPIFFSPHKGLMLYYSKIVN